MSRRIRELVDWRLFASIAAVGLLVLLGVVVLDSARARHEAFTTLQDSRETISRRIDLLQETIAEQSDALVQAEATVAALREDVTALQAQLVGLGVQPVIVLDTEEREPAAEPPRASSSQPDRPANAPPPPPAPPEPAPPPPGPPPAPEPEPDPPPEQGPVGGAVDQVCDLLPLGC